MQRITRSVSDDDRMIHKLRRDMVTSTMTLLTLIVVAVMCAILALLNFNSQQMLNQSLDRILRSDTRPSTHERALTGGILVTIDKSGAILSSTYPPELDEGIVASMTSMALANGESRGEISFDNYDFAYMRRPALKNNDKIAFENLSSLRETNRTNALVCIGAGTAFIALLYGVTVFFASRSIKPVKNAFDLQRAFVADASHELKTPLTILSADISVIKGHPDETVAQQARWLDAMQDQLGRMNGLISSMLTLARMESLGRDSAPHTPVDISELVSSSMLYFEAVFFENSLSCTYDITDGLRTTGDREQLERLVSILLDNACGHTPKSGTVAVRLEKFKAHARLSVQNSGGGIPAEHMAHLFDRFYRADDSRDRQSGGFGLGLAIAKATAVCNGADIKVESEEGKYARFIVDFAPMH